jgi:hypothetical protein
MICDWSIPGPTSPTKIFMCIWMHSSEVNSDLAPIHWVPVALSLGVKRPGRKADHSPPYSAEVKECVELYLHSPIRVHGMVLS